MVGHLPSLPLGLVRRGTVEIYFLRPVATTSYATRLLFSRASCWPQVSPTTCPPNTLRSTALFRAHPWSKLWKTTLFWSTTWRKVRD